VRHLQAQQAHESAVRNTQRRYFLFTAAVRLRCRNFFTRRMRSSPPRHFLTSGAFGRAVYFKEGGCVASTARIGSGPDPHIVWDRCTGRRTRVKQVLDLSIYTTTMQPTRRRMSVAALLTWTLGYGVRHYRSLSDAASTFRRQQAAFGRRLSVVTRHVQAPAKTHFAKFTHACVR